VSWEPVAESVAQVEDRRTRAEMGFALLAVVSMDVDGVDGPVRRGVGAATDLEFAIFCGDGGIVAVQSAEV
jgi:hypothetical protein